MIIKWLRSVSLMTMLLMVSIATSADSSELSFQKNRAKRTDEPRAINATQPEKIPGQVFGTHPFFAKLSVKVYSKEEGTYQEIVSPIANLKPGMILDLPLYESKARQNTRTGMDGTLPEPSVTDSYFWSDWDMGDRDVLPENSDLKWFILTLKEEYKAPNVAECNLLGTSSSPTVVSFNANETDSERWAKLELAAQKAGELVRLGGNVLQNNQNTPWGNCFTEVEMTKLDITDPNVAQLRDVITEHAIIVPILGADQRIGFKITPDSLLGFPKSGYQAYVWDISQIWAQQVPVRTENAVTSQNSENEFADINVIFPEYFALDGINNDMALPIGKHPIISSPQVIPFEGEYRIRIFDKEYYDSNKDNLDNSYDLSKLARNLPKEQYKGFYTNRQYVAVVEILDKVSFRVRPLTRDEVNYNSSDPQDKNVYWQLEWEDTHEKYIASDTNTIEAEKPYIISYEYADEKDRTDPKVEIMYKKNAQNIETDEVEYIQFNAQVNNKARIGEVEGNKQNPELGEQSFKATVGFMYDD